MPRSRWWLNHPIQRKYLLIVAAAMAAPTLLIGFCLYHLVFYLLARQMAFPEAIFANLVPVIRRVNLFLWVALPALGVVILWFAVVISHRLAGPIERLEKELDEILKSRSSRKIQIRRGDDLKGLEGRINELLSRL